MIWLRNLMSQHWPAQIKLQGGGLLCVRWNRAGGVSRWIEVRAGGSDRAGGGWPQWQRDPPSLILPHILFSLSLGSSFHQLYSWRRTKEAHRPTWSSLTLRRPLDSTMHSHGAAASVPMGSLVPHSTSFSRQLLSLYIVHTGLRNQLKNEGILSGEEAYFLFTHFTHLRV